MALRPCRECNHDVSDSAKTCPHCGINSPALAGAKSGRSRRWLWILPLLVIAMLIVLQHKGGTTNESATCVNDFRKCTDNADVVNNNLDAKYAGGLCRSEVDDHVKYGSPKWPWVKFGKFHTGNDFPRTGEIWIIDDEVQIQNMYGAMARTTVQCKFDLASKKVIEIGIDGVPITISERAVKQNSSEPTPPTEAATNVDLNRIPAPGQTFTSGSYVDIYRAFMPDFDEKTQKGSYRFARLPSGNEFKDVADWTGRSLHLTFIGTQDLGVKGTLHYFSSVPGWQDYTCHACTPIVSAMLTRSSGGVESIVIPLLPMARAGSWGKYVIDQQLPEHVSVGPSKMAIFLRDGWMAQGEGGTSVNLVEIGDQSFQLLGEFNVGRDSTGTGNCGGPDQKICEKFNVTISFDQTGPGPYYPLIAHISGVMDDKDFKPHAVEEKRVVAFDGTRYPYTWKTE